MEDAGRRKSADPPMVEQAEFYEAMIREVAAWLRSEYPGREGYGTAWANLLEQEANRSTDESTNYCQLAEQSAKSPTAPMILYHVTTPKKAKAYRQTGHIIAPVRGFTSLQAAMAWALKVRRTVIYQFDADRPYKLPDHHNKYGEAWWNDNAVYKFKCVFSADSDA